MTQTPDTKRIAAERGESANGGAPEEGGLGAVPQRAADRLGLAGPEGSRRRGALLRRLLAMGDWLALLIGLFFVTATTTSVNVADLFWAVLFSPVWILVVKLHGLYDNDHRRIRHSTLDELPSLISATVLGTLVLDGLLSLTSSGAFTAAAAITLGVVTLVASFLLRGILRWFWGHATAPALGIVIGPAPVVDTIARRVATHPETRLTLVGYLSSTSGDSAELPRLGTLADISEVAAATEIERVVVTEQEMSEPTAERLIEECEAAGPALTF